MLTFKTKKINSTVALVYGFSKNKKNYDLVLTLIKNKNKTEIHGLLSKVSLGVQGFSKLLEFLNTIIETDFITFELLEEHAKIYKLFIDFYKIEKSKTFDGYRSEIITIKKGTKCHLPF